jgi:hypothetical protein
MHAMRFVRANLRRAVAAAKIRNTWFDRLAVAANASVDWPRLNSSGTGIDVRSNSEGHCFIKGRALSGV